MGTGFATRANMARVIAAGWTEFAAAATGPLKPNSGSPANATATSARAPRSLRMRRSMPSWVPFGQAVIHRKSGARSYHITGRSDRLSIRSCGLRPKTVRMPAVDLPLIPDGGVFYMRHNAAARFAVGLGITALVLALQTPAFADWPTYHKDAARTGLDPTAPALISSVNQQW